MGLMDTLLQQVTGAMSADSVEHLQNAPTGTLGQCITAMFHSDQTPPFADMVGQLFGQSNDAQRAGMLNQLLAAAGPALLAQAGGALGASLPPGTTELTPEQASQFSATDVHAMAAQVQQANPGVVEAIGHFYSEHPALIKTLGSAALAIGLAKLREHQQA
ncbi:hypothetical protein [Dyella japonica]|uniref:Uncharacterized protein n=1 Tax=Dyella japonica DSM 16301 TaxID=1440762 RepID=A0A0G9H3K1_9GAMM|nr:hypothetical protein [Dyella japonica]KLD64086.1 hypothetical protein Y882_08355 [Dyella japonica DSM 16301]